MRGSRASVTLMQLGEHNQPCNTNMATQHAPQTLTDVEHLLANDTKVKVAGIDVDGVLRGKDIHDQTYTNELSISNLANGYRDVIARIDLSTFRRIPWEHNLPFFLVEFMDPDDPEKPLLACPRGLLKRIVKEFENQGSGLAPYAGTEYEYFQFKETPQSASEKGYANLSPLTPGMHGYSLLRTGLNQDYFHAIFDMCEKFEVPIEGHHTETGPGVFETALEYTSATRMADNAALFKLTAKNVGILHGVMPSFMAKPHNNLPGCSGHVHISLRHLETGQNAFANKEGKRQGVKFEEAAYLSEEAESFLAGVLEGLPSIMPMLVPTVNGYKRLVEGFWAATTVSWGYESRLASIRVIGPPLVAPSATRIEVRVPGADMNAHLCIAAILACGLYGMRNHLTLQIPSITPELGPTMKPLPRTLIEATEVFMAKDSIARLVLGDEWVDHFGGTRLHEWGVFSKTVTNWEIERYLELA